MTVRVGVRAPGSQARVVILAVMSILAAALVGTAGGMLVTQNDSIDHMHAERYTLPSTFMVSGTSFSDSFPIPDQAGDPPPAGTKMAASPNGTEDNPVPITPAMTPGWTPYTLGNWVWTVTVREARPGLVVPGDYAVEALVDGVSLGLLYVRNEASAAAETDVLAKGARLTFELGPQGPGAGLFTVVVSTSGGDVYYIESIYNTTAANWWWRGVGGEIDGQISPRLDATVGALLRITYINADGMAPHDLYIDTDAKRSNGYKANGPLVDYMERATLEWTPDAPGDYYYYCSLHLPTQKGIIRVEA